MFHVMLPCSAEVVEKARDKVAEDQGIWLSNRFWNYDGNAVCAMEITIGEKALTLPSPKLRLAIAQLVEEITKSG